MRIVVILILAASAALAQVNQALHFTQHQSTQDLQELVTLLRSTADLRQVFLDEPAATVNVSGTAGQIATADWLLHQVDLPRSGVGVHEYRPPAGGDDVVRVFYVKHAATPQALQEIVTTLRSVADIRRLFVYNKLQALAARGTDQQIALAAWMLERIDQPAGAAMPTPQEYQVGGNDVARIFKLTYAETPQQLQEITTLIRSVADLQRLFVCFGPRILALRGPTDRVALSTWLVAELDKPTNAPRSGDDPAARHEYRLANDPADTVRVFYLTGAPSSESRQKVVEQVRSTAGIRRLFVYNALGALAVRGSIGQVATAEKTIEELKAQ